MELCTFSAFLESEAGTAILSVLSNIKFFGDCCVQGVTKLMWQVSHNIGHFQSQPSTIGGSIF